MTSVRCPMRECRRSIDLDALPAWPERPAAAPCLHFIAAWGEGRESMGLEVLHALEGNRELVIRNVRPPEISRALLEEHRERIEGAIAAFAHVVDGVALFGDQHERDAVSRELAQILIGPDPMVSRLAAG
ncbi:MAG: hypothetical protein AB7I38_07975 [Dehalococcoidia bacterium]